jgi:hypothetical protein
MVVSQNAPAFRVNGEQAGTHGDISVLHRRVADESGFKTFDPDESKRCNAPD